MDLENVLVTCENWDPKKVHSPWREFFPNIEFDLHLPNAHMAYPMSVKVPIAWDCLAAVEGYVDDGFAIMAGNRALMERTYECRPLATHIFSRPVASDEPILRPTPLSAPKCKAEGRMEEQNRFLGCDFYFNQHNINLIDDKAEKYIGDLENMKLTKKTSEKVMESVVGKINVIGFVLPATRHFTARFRKRIIKCKNWDNDLDDDEILDSKLWVIFF